MKYSIFISLLIYTSIAMGQMDTVKASKPRHSSKEVQPIDFYLGIGVGLDCGGVGFNLLFYPQKNIGIFGGVGYAFAGLGLNGGLKARLTPGRSANPFLICMYGYNTAVVIKNAIYENRLFYGVSPGIGIDIPLKNHNIHS